jgi:hypothetical protein
MTRQLCVHLMYFVQRMRKTKQALTILSCYRLTSWMSANMSRALCCNVLPSSKRLINYLNTCELWLYHKFLQCSHLSSPAYFLNNGNVLDLRFSHQWLQTVLSYGMWHWVTWYKFTDALEKHIASIIEVKQSQASRMGQLVACFLLVSWLTLQLWRLKQYVPQNLSDFLPDYMASHLRRQYCSKGTSSCTMRPGELSYYSDRLQAR